MAAIGIDQSKLTDYNYRQSLRDQGFNVGSNDGGATVFVESGSGQPVASGAGPNAPAASNQGNAANPAAGPAPAAPASPPVTADQIYNTPNGPRTLGQITQELQKAGYGGAQDPSSLFTTYYNTAQSGKDAASAQKQAGLDANAKEAQAAYQQYLNAANAQAAKQQAFANQLAQQQAGLAQQNFELQRTAASDAHAKALQDLQLATNADQRAQALVNIQQAQEKLNEVTQAETKRQFDLNLTQRQTEFNQTQYSDMAKTLLSGAASLRGPQDWAQYTKYVTGGRNLNDTLFGTTPAPKFAASAGYTPPVSVGGVAGDLGLIPGAGTAGGGAPQQQAGQQVPLPHQWDPATWDSMPDTAKQLILGMAQAGNTSSGAWDPNDYQKIIDASRPVGTSGGAGMRQYATTQSAF